MTHTDHKALIIMAHGSRRAEANEEFFTLVAQIDTNNDLYNIVKPALLEQAPPTLLQACQTLPDQITHVDVYPLFFNQGRHVERDIPAQVAEVIEAMPDKSFRLLDYFGKSPSLANFVIEQITHHNGT